MNDSPLTTQTIEQRLADIETKHRRTRFALVVLTGWVIYQGFTIPSLIAAKKVRAEEYGLDASGKYYGRLIVGESGPEFWTTEGNVIPLIGQDQKTENKRTTQKKVESK